MSIDTLASFHEAGHAVRALHFGAWVRELRLHDGGGATAGHCVVADWLDTVEHNPVAAITYVLSGLSAERRVSGVKSAGGAKDLVQARAIAALVVHDGADENGAKVAATLRTCTVLADAAMQDDHTWREVEVIARALRQRRCLTGDDLHRLLRGVRR